MVLIYYSKKLYRSYKASHEAPKPVSESTPQPESTITSTSTSTSPSKSKPVPLCRHRTEPGSEPCLICKSEHSAQRKYRWTIILGMFLPYALQALDVTVIASAVPWIAADFHEIGQLNWIISSFNLTAAAFIPFWGQMADIFGRHVAIQASMVIMLVGSAICTGSPTDAFAVLLLGRGFQGLGCAGVNVVVRSIIADKVSLRENAKNWSIFAFVGGISYGLGPVIGGYLTNTNWRWCFGINLPVGVAAMIVVFFFVRKELLGPQPIPELEETAQTGRRTTFKRRLMTIDAGGQLLFLFGFGLLILAFTWAGETYAWNSPAVLISLILGFVLSVGFVFWEYYMVPGNFLSRKFPWQKSMISWELIVNRDMGILFYTSFATGMAMYAVLYFCNLYFTMVLRYPSSKAGVQLLYYTPGLGFGVYLSSFLCGKAPRQTWPPIMLGSVIEAVGMGVLAWALWIQHIPTIYGMMALTGVGTGLRFMPVPLHGIGYFPKRISGVISLIAVSLPFGGTVGLTIMTTVFNNASGISSASSDRDFSSLANLPPDVLAEVTHNAKMGIVWAFVALCPFMVLCVISAAFLGNVFIARETKGENEDENTIYPGVYLLALLRGQGTAVRADAEKTTTTEHGMEMKSYPGYQELRT